MNTGVCDLHLHLEDRKTRKRDECINPLLAERVLLWLRLFCHLINGCGRVQDALRDRVEIQIGDKVEFNSGLFVLLSHCATDVAIPLAREWYKY